MVTSFYITTPTSKLTTPFGLPIPGTKDKDPITLKFKLMVTSLYMMLKTNQPGPPIPGTKVKLLTDLPSKTTEMLYYMTRTTLPLGLLTLGNKPLNPFLTPNTLTEIPFIKNSSSTIINISNPNVTDGS